MARNAALTWCENPTCKIKVLSQAPKHFHCDDVAGVVFSEIKDECIVSWLLTIKADGQRKILGLKPGVSTMPKKVLDRYLIKTMIKNDISDALIVASAKPKLMENK